MGLREGKPLVLMVEDTVSLARTYLEYLKNEDIVCEHVETGRQALDKLAEQEPDAILLDLMLPDMGGLEILEHIHQKEIPTSVIVITAHGSINTAVEAMRLGATDFLVKPFSADRLLVTLRNALERQRLTRLVETYKQDIDRHEFCGFVGSSLAMQGVYRIIESAANSKATVFVTGESGTGKEVTAEAIHQLSPRNDKPFVAINCAAIPKELMESEIFGHIKGAFTGAVSDREGAASRANGGTLFLDEICEMDLSLQTKLLRFIQTGTIQRVGDTRLQEVDVRFVCATNRDPLIEVAAGRFREDLYYRLHVIPVHLPPLRERDGDVVSIAEHFLNEFASEENKVFQGFDAEAQEIIRRYPWPGNVRQLQNVIRNTVVLNSGDWVTPDMLPPPVGHGGAVGGEADPLTVNEAPYQGSQYERGYPPPAEPMMPPHGTSQGGKPCGPASPSELLSQIRPLSVVERETIEHAIDLCDGNIPKAATFLGVSASTIYRKKAAWDEAAAN